MVVFDVAVNGSVVETLMPVNQRPSEIKWFVFDKVEEMKVKYNNKFTLTRRYIYL